MTKNEDHAKLPVGQRGVRYGLGIPSALSAKICQKL